MLCARLGMVKVGTVALDGTKIGAIVSKDANRAEAGCGSWRRTWPPGTPPRTRRRMPSLFGDGRGDDDPGAPFTRAERGAAALSSLEREPSPLPARTGSSLPASAETW